MKLYYSIKGVHTMFFTQNTKIGYILASSKGREILLKHAPELKDSPFIFFTKMKSLSEYVTSNQSINRTEGWLETVMNELSAVEYVVDENTDVVPLPNYESDSIPAGSAKIAAAESVGKWDIFEIELNGPSHGNPFVDVAISAQFSCDEYSVDINGFYDGNGTYKIRFMPEKEGQWSYSTTSNARSLNGIEGQFTCVAANDTNRGQVRVADTFHFKYSNGTRYLPVGTTCYAWTHQPIELQEQTLETLSHSPFNKMRMCIFPKAYLYNENEPAHYPFEGSLEDGFDYTRFNPAFFQHLDKRIAELKKLGIEADLILFHAYDRWGFSEMGKSADDRYLKYVTARLSAFSNVWWSLANEYDLMWSKEEDDWERFASIVTNHDPYNHLISVHNCFKFYDYTKPWVTHCSVQRVDVYRTSENTDEWRKQWGKPVVIDECGYEGNINMGWGNIPGQEMVRRFWEGGIRGGYVGHGETYLHPEDILWWSKGGELHGTSSQRIGFLREIIEQSPNGILNPVVSEWDVPAAGIVDEFYLYYYGFNQPSYREFTMSPGIQYKVDVIDTWNMTIEEQKGTYEGNFRIELPARQYMAIRLTAV
jgi:hypothetical protein